MQIDETGYARACVACGRTEPVSVPNIGRTGVGSRRSVGLASLVDGQGETEPLDLEEQSNGT